MHIAVLEYPGTWIDGIPRANASRAQDLLSASEQALKEAALSLTHYEEACRAFPASKERWERHAERRQERRNRVREQYEARGQVPDWNVIEAEAQKLSLQAGDCPKEYEDALSFLHAKGFLFALDMVGKMLTVLADEPWAPVALQTVADDWETAFPQLKPVRDTALHLEDRVRGLDRNRRRLKLAPDLPVLVFNALFENRYGCTLSDGTYGAVEVSQRNLDVATALIQRAIDAFQWRGPPQLVPRF